MCFFELSTLIRKLRERYLQKSQKIVEIDVVFAMTDLKHSWINLAPIFFQPYSEDIGLKFCEENLVVTELVHPDKAASVHQFGK